MNTGQQRDKLRRNRQNYKPAAFSNLALSFFSKKTKKLPQSIAVLKKTFIIVNKHLFNIILTFAKITCKLFKT